MNEKSQEIPVLVNSPDDPTCKNDSASKQWKWQFDEFSPNDSWSPSVNVYRVSRRMEICIDLSGMDVNKIDLQVQAGILTVRGVRVAPDARKSTEEPCKILSMEIPHGPFCKEISIPEQLDLSRMTTRYSQGYLWVTLPLRSQG